MLVGASLGVSGAVMQALTRNPLADPGLLGVNAGASLSVVSAISLFGLRSTSQLVWFAFGGAAVASVVVYLLGSRGGPASPVRLALSGAAVSALLIAVTRTVTLLDPTALDLFRFWAVGSLSGADVQVAADVAVFIGVGLLIAVGTTRAMNALALGDDAASALGVRIGVTRTMAGTAVVLLCGSAVAAVGPIGFVGLVIPHAVRALTGPDQRWLMAGCAVAGPLVLIGCDIVGRVVARPGEVRAGIITAVIGGSLFVVIVRRAQPVQS